MNLNNIRLRSVAVMTVLQYFANVSVSVLSSGSYSYVHTSLFSPLLELKGVAQFSCIPRCNLKDPWERVGVSAVGKLWRQSREKHVSQKTPRRSVYGRDRRPDRWEEGVGGGGWSSVCGGSLTSAVDLDPWVKHPDAQRAGELIDPVLEQQKGFSVYTHTLNASLCNDK